MPKNQANKVDQALEQQVAAGDAPLTNTPSVTEVAAEAMEARNDGALEATCRDDAPASICRQGCEQCAANPGPLVQSASFIADRIEMLSNLETAAVEIATGLVAARARELGQPYLSVLAGTGSHGEAKTEAELELIARAASNIARRVLAKCEDVQLAE